MSSLTLEAVRGRWSPNSDKDLYGPFLHQVLNETDGQAMHCYKLSTDMYSHKIILIIKQAIYP